MLEQIILIKQFILNAPASQDEHNKVLGMFQQVNNHYNEQIQKLQQENEKLKEKEDGE